MGFLIKIIDNGFNYRQIRSREIAPEHENMRQKSCNVLMLCLSLLCLLFLDTVVHITSAFCTITLPTMGYFNFIHTHILVYIEEREPTVFPLLIPNTTLYHSTL